MRRGCCEVEGRRVPVGGEMGRRIEVEKCEVALCDEGTVPLGYLLYEITSQGS